jgi:hypothetical protein
VLALVAHGGTAGAIAEALIALVVIGVLVAVWLRERSARRAEEESIDPGD